MKGKRIREKGKISFTKFFQKFNEGDFVAVARDFGQTASFPKRIQGRTGKVIGKRGRSYIVEIKDIKMPKQYIIKPIHLKKIKVTAK
ncbi:50S ribosomal protein L21e [Candidatus Pacearchaeota archaeon CG10_big_fil_rev_8_21_14_0_10_35_219]|nr:50S ribosomal protein L21e [Candidatus Pacearchaeota archaeon]OIO42234.1 MAG: hypothetical protein AUJ63_03060 [Candidatus Pacearchaeota archaeon CG1_02_35_32]PIO07296.1 MAG: 50S ribosomal protein L21e [Candidatus Pacearchaeota archaeon CG10_big_fil_rev_8_21_14_0_10_35_219]PIY81346.1 MAG: 50S ribosomal protein L21e [Candidatus Pacearchaeota archaeon CG_4_10_14_0_8_um_filter_35_169]PIZ79802.1 MAG: 50S ribosomal protein L21e [Candidatus Pacearchaeota archaeon CG_4_10_14_0_2_um_filter_35_33]PJ